MQSAKALQHHEALDRTFILLEHLENLLGEHSVIQNENSYKELYDHAYKSLFTLYQQLGADS